MFPAAANKVDESSPLFVAAAKKVDEFSKADSSPLATAPALQVLDNTIKDTQLMLPRHSMGAYIE
jgi:hypothetical protein